MRLSERLAIAEKTKYCLINYVVQQIIAIPVEECTFENTFVPIANAFSRYFVDPNEFVAMLYGADLWSDQNENPLTKNLLEYRVFAGNIYNHFSLALRNGELLKRLEFIEPTASLVKTPFPGEVKLYLEYIISFVRNFLGMEIESFEQALRYETTKVFHVYWVKRVGMDESQYAVLSGEFESDLHLSTCSTYWKIYNPSYTQIEFIYLVLKRDQFFVTESGEYDFNASPGDETSCISYTTLDKNKLIRLAQYVKDDAHQYTEKSIANMYGLEKSAFKDNRNVYYTLFKYELDAMKRKGYTQHSIEFYNIRNIGRDPLPENHPYAKLSVETRMEYALEYCTSFAKMVPVRIRPNTKIWSSLLGSRVEQRALNGSGYTFETLGEIAWAICSNGIKIGTLERWKRELLETGRSTGVPVHPLEYRLKNGFYHNGLYYNESELEQFMGEHQNFFDEIFPVMSIFLVRPHCKHGLDTVFPLTAGRIGTCQITYGQVSFPSETVPYSPLKWSLNMEAELAWFCSIGAMVYYTMAASRSAYNIMLPIFLSNRVQQIEFAFQRLAIRREYVNFLNSKLDGALALGPGYLLQNDFRLHHNNFYKIFLEFLKQTVQFEARKIDRSLGEDEFIEKLVEKILYYTRTAGLPETSDFLKHNFISPASSLKTAYNYFTSNVSQEESFWEYLLEMTVRYE